MARNQDDADRDLIRAAMAYRSGSDSCNSVYLGSMARAGLYHVLGLKYGEGDFAQALNQATRAQLDGLLAKCGSIIKYMRANPTQPCPLCGSIIDVAIQQQLEAKVIDSASGLRNLDDLIETLSSVPAELRQRMEIRVLTPDGMPVDGFRLIEAVQNGSKVRSLVLTVRPSS